MMAFYDTNLVLFQATMVGLLLALSVQVPIRVGVFSFAGVGAFGIGNYGGAILVLDYQMSALPTLLVMAVVGAVVVFVLGCLINRLVGLYLAMATVAFDLTITVIAINGGELTGGSTGRFGVLTDFTMGHMWAISIAALVLVALSELGRTKRRVDAAREDPELAASMGINVRRYRLTAFAVSGALGAMAGTMNVFVRFTVNPLDIGFGQIVLALTMIIVGGALSWRGALLGAVVFTWLPEVLLVVGEWQEVIYGAVVAVAAVLLPGGIYGLYVDGKRRFRQRRHAAPETLGGAVASDDRSDDEKLLIGSTPEKEAPQ